MSEKSPNLEKLKFLHFRHRKGLLSAVSTDCVATADEQAVQLDEQESISCSTHEEIPKLTNSLVKEAAKLKASIGDRCKVFVGNISYKVKTRELKEFFSYFGKVVHAQIIQDRVKKRSRGFAFVTFSNEWEAERAKAASESEQTLDGRLMTVLPPQRKRKGHFASTGPSLQEALKIYQGNQSDVNHTGEENVTTDALMSEAHTENGDQETPTQQRLTIGSLNDDTMFHIFSYLNVKERIQIERVCRRWRLLASKSWQFVNHLDFHGIFVAFRGSGGLTDDILLSILRRGCQSLKSMDLSASSHFLTEFAVHCIGKHCKNLKDLDLTGVDMATSALKFLAKECTRLEKIKLERCYKVGEKALWWLLKQCKHLQHINLAGNKRLTGQTCRSLTLQGCSRLADAGLVHVGNKCQNLQSVDLSECTSLTDTGILQLLQNCTKIERFVLSQPGREVTTQAMNGLSNLTMLRELNISRNEIVNDDVLYHIGRCCIHLISLNLEACQGGITDAGLQSLASCYQLKSLVISYLDKVTDVSISQLAANGTLEKFVARVCPGLTDQGVESLLRHCVQLRSLDLSGCYVITNTSLEFVRLYCVTPDRPLLEFTLGGTSVTDDGVTLTRDTKSRCNLVRTNLSSVHLRTDLDPYLQMGSFLPPDEIEDEDDFDDFDETETPLMRSEEEFVEDFLIADDPSLVYEERWS